MLCPWRTVTESGEFYAKPGGWARTDFQECLGTACAAYVPERKVGEFTLNEACLRARELRGELPSTGGST